MGVGVGVGLGVGLGLGVGVGFGVGAGDTVIEMDCRANRPPSQFRSLQALAAHVEEPADPASTRTEKMADSSPESRPPSSASESEFGAEHRDPTGP